MYIYPDIPIYARLPNYSKTNPSYRQRGAARWPPVPYEYKNGGYAYDLIFIDAQIFVDPGGGPPFDFRLRLKSWIDACGYYARLPEKYISG